MQELQERSINTIRFLAIDAIQKANSGHPGLPMGAAPMGYVLWKKFLKHNPKNPSWPDRDRFVLSGGHGSMLIYSLLHLTGYPDMTIDQIKNFRQLGSLTPGHPESHLTPGVEATTGPLGQGISNSVGMAVAERFLAEAFNRNGYKIVDHYTYVIASDGDLMEGVSQEACSLAGHLKLGKLIVLYDDNKISLAAPTSVCFSEDVAGRYKSYGWQVLEVDDGNTDIDAIGKAIQDAKSDSEHPSLIMIRTTIGFGSPAKANTPDAHGSPLGEDEVKATKENMGWPLEPEFHVPDDVLKHFREALKEGEKQEGSWRDLMEKYNNEYPELGKEWESIWNAKLPAKWEDVLPSYSPEDGSIATRKASGTAINAVAPVIKNLIGGSADLAPSTNTYMKDIDEQQADKPGGRNVRFGVREHAMGSMVNGMAYHGGVIPYGGTFLTFSDYMRGAIRVSALASLHTIWVFTHDSVWLGEDGPTHQPVEHLAALRAIPNLTVIRPCDANETVEAWKCALKSDGPVALVLSRQGLPVLNRKKFASEDGFLKGGYILSDPDDGKPDVIFIATGSEVSLALETEKLLEKDGIKCRVVSMPSWELFEAQSEEYKKKVLPPSIKARVAIEAGVSQGWCRYAGEKGRIVSQDSFGASAPYKDLREKFGFTADRVVKEAKASIKGAKE
ncbi:MAG: transketolase [Spirochaetota bacterium]|nr:MAG: transketolase [Spirochaetota bacterium]